MVRRSKWWVLALGLGVSCAGHQPPASAPASLPLGLIIPPRVDSVVVVAHRPLLGKLLGLPTPRPVVAAGALGRVGKKSVVSVYYGPATVSTAAKNAAAGAGATAAAKAAAPVAGAGATSQDYRKQGQRGGAAASGRAATATATTSKGLSWWWLLVPVVGYLGWRVYKRFWLV